MELEFDRPESQPMGVSSPPRSSLRLRYEAEVEVIQRQIGDLERVRVQLGLSARKICQLLMVDPSAWNRWTKGTTKPPPHIWRALQWYLILQEKIPGLTPIYFLGGSSETLAQELKTEFEKQCQSIKQDQETLSAKQRVEIQEITARLHKATQAENFLSSQVDRLERKIKRSYLISFGLSIGAIVLLLLALARG